MSDEVVVEGHCPFNECRKKIELPLDHEEVVDGAKLIEECPGCERDLEITLLVLQENILADFSPAST